MTASGQRQARGDDGIRIRIGIGARLRTAVEGLNPGAFAFVMATGIVSVALDRGSARTASAWLLWIGVAGYALLVVAYAYRLLRWRARVVADLTGPLGFGFLTFVAATGVLASRFALDGHTTVAVVLLTAGATAWVLLDYGVPLALIGSRKRRPSLDQVNGTWFLWTVATQSVAVAAATLAHSRPSDALTGLASVCWAVGLTQYVLTAALALARLLVRPVTPADVNPPYWIFMGAAAITVLAGAKLRQLPPGAALVPHPTVTGLSLVLWAFCTWLFPLLIALGVWRYGLGGLPLRYETGLWSVVFPLGMYGVGTRELGRATGIHWLVTLGGTEAWVAAGAWAAVLAAMAYTGVRAGVDATRRLPQRG